MTMFRLFTILILTTASSAALAEGRSVAISGSVQFWQRACNEAYECGLPVAVSERSPVAAVIHEPAAAGEVSMEHVDVSAGGMTTRLGVFWKKEAAVSYLAGQSLLTVDGKRVAECSHYGSAQVDTFIPVGFCAGYVHSDSGIVQYGVTYYKAPAK